MNSNQNPARNVEQCNIANGTYACHRPKGHGGSHNGSNRRGFYYFSAAYTPVRFINTKG